jgi:DNA-binding GntR family transcriptional regulator
MNYKKSGAMPFSPDAISSTALYEQVASRLRERIYDGLLPAGEPIDEPALCALFGISRTPLREALKVLDREGLVELVPRRGCVVRSLSMEDLAELFPVIAVLEGLCAREAVTRCTEGDLAELETMHQALEEYAAAHDLNAYYDQNYRIHEAIQTLAGNRWLRRVTADLRRILRLARHEQLKQSGRLQESLSEHRGLMDAFRQKAPELADQRMQRHLCNQWKALEAYKEEQDRAVT